MKVEELYKSIEKSKVITTELTEILLEMDITNSVTTQASLNNLLIELRNRVKNEKDIYIKSISNNDTVSVEDMDKWVCENFTPYSTHLYKETIKHQK